MASKSEQENKLRIKLAQDPLYTNVRFDKGPKGRVLSFTFQNKKFELQLSGSHTLYEIVGESYKMVVIFLNGLPSKTLLTKELHIELWKRLVR